MKKYINKAIILSLLVGFSGYSVQSLADGQGAPQAVDRETIREEATFSPRAHCRAGNGIVKETSKNDVYLCCYQAKHKCLAIDTHKSISWSVAYEAKEIGNVDSYLGSNHAY